MLGIYTKGVNHHLAIHSLVILVVQRKRRVSEEKRVTIDEEVRKPYDIRFIT